MTATRYRIAALDTAHDRKVFNSGSTPLDRYFHEQVTQDIRRHYTACFVALAPDNGVVGYYTLAAADVLLTDLPPKLQRKLPRYPTVPVARMGRLAVDQQHRGQGLGAALLADALARTARADIAAYALLVDAKDEEAMAFYKHHGFIVLDAEHRSLFLPLEMVRAF
ncbi:MAG: GNAT family N-acetyltransferase [Gammaproteobacteria bacterium]|nr:GNAT family N-acetyltransferase [Gammaproteobacteria bacterium]